MNQFEKTGSNSGLRGTRQAAGQQPALGSRGRYMIIRVLRRKAAGLFGRFVGPAYDAKARPQQGSDSPESTAVSTCARTLTPILLVTLRSRGRQPEMTVTAAWSLSRTLNLEGSACCLSECHSEHGTRG
jgi:hypothetical protein